MITLEELGVKHLSFSSVSLFESCPSKWILEKIAHVQKETNQYIEHGRIVHKQIELLLKEGLYAIDLENRYPETQSVIKMIDRLNFRIIPENVESEALKDMGLEVPFMAKADLLLEDLVLDWKTSKKGWTKQAHLTKNQAVAYMGMWLRDVSFWVLKPEAEEPDIRFVPYDSARVNTYFMGVRQIANQMKEGEYIRNVSRECEFCSVRRTCKPLINKYNTITYSEACRIRDEARQLQYSATTSESVNKSD